MNRRLPLALLALVLTLGVASQARSQEKLGVDNRAAIGQPQGAPLTDEILERRTEEIASLMRCPVCQGLSIADSPTLLAQAMRSEVRQFVAAGYTEDQILRYFEQSYGEFIRLEPRASGFNLVVWLAPVVILLAGVALIAYRLRPRRRAAEAGSVADPAELASYRERVRREVAS